MFHTKADTHPVIQLVFPHREVTSYARQNPSSAAWFRIAGTPEFRHNARMETVKIGKKGQVTIPRRVLEEAGLPAESQVIIESEPDGSIRLRPAVVYPIELYSDERIADFERENRLPGSLRERVGQAVNRRAKNK